MPTDKAWHFRDVTIPARVLYLLLEGKKKKGEKGERMGITGRDLVLLALIDDLVTTHGTSPGRGCWASNGYLANTLNTTETVISQRLTHLWKLGLIMTIEFEGTRYLECEWSRIAEERSKMTDDYGHLVRRAHMQLMDDLELERRRQCKVREPEKKPKKIERGTPILANAKIPPILANAKTPSYQMLTHNKEEEEGVGRGTAVPSLPPQECSPPPDEKNGEFAKSRKPQPKTKPTDFPPFVRKWDEDIRRILREAAEPVILSPRDRNGVVCGLKALHQLYIETKLDIPRIERMIRWLKNNINTLDFRPNGPTQFAEQFSIWEDKRKKAKAASNGQANGFHRNGYQPEEDAEEMIRREHAESRRNGGGHA